MEATYLRDVGFHKFWLGAQWNSSDLIKDTAVKLQKKQYVFLAGQILNRR